MFSNLKLNANELFRTIVLQILRILYFEESFKRIVTFNLYYV